MPSRHVVFVAPFFMTATLRFVAGAAALEGVRLSLVSQEPLERLPSELARRLTGHWRIADCFDPAQLVDGVRALGTRFGPVERLIGSLEQLQVPLAEARQTLGLPGLGPEIARNFRDKNRMKDLFARAGVPCARHRLVDSAEAAREFVSAVGFPVVVKPPAGAGAASTFRLNDATAFESYLRSFRPGVLFEEFLQGEEHSFDSVMVGGQLLWHSISVYRPAPLTVVENPWIQWCVLLPREIEGVEYAPIREQGERALRALGLETGMTHMEWFRRPDGSVAISEVAARPPGAQFTTLLSYACDLDFYRAWPRLSVFDAFEPPRREHATGAAYLRGIGRGRVRRVDGVEPLLHECGSLIVEAEWPKPGRLQAEGYEGAGYVIFRHRDTSRVERALRRAVELIRVELG